MGALASQQNGTLDFRDGSTSDISTALIHVRFTPESGHVQCGNVCPLWANSGHDAHNHKDFLFTAVVFELSTIRSWLK
jgi:hypothetical protein